MDVLSSSILGIIFTLWAQNQVQHVENKKQRSLKQVENDEKVFICKRQQC